jgi:hypothetical protein
VINFRYHVVSLVAVLASLAIGLVLGAGVLSSGTGSASAVQVVDLQAETALLRERVAAAENTLAFADAFGAVLQPEQVAGTLTDRSVVVVALPGADEPTVTATRDALSRAGATVTGTIQVLPEWTDAASGAVLDSLASQLVTSGASLPSSDGYARGAVVLASAVLEPAGSSEKDPQDVTATPQAYAEAGLVALSEPLSATADLAVVVAGGPVADDGEAGRRIAAQVALAAAMDQAGSGAVLAGPPESAGPFGTVEAVRSDAELAASLSTVDMAQQSGGRTSAVLALAEQAGGGVGHYGGVGVDEPLPPASQ